MADAPSRRNGETIVVASASIIVASPVLFNPAGYDQFQLPRLIVQTVAVVIGLVAMLVGTGPPIRRVFVPLAALLSVMFVSAIVSDAPRVALLGTGSRHFGFVGWLTLAAGFVLGTACSSTVRRLVLLRVLLASSVAISLYAIFQRLGWDPFSPAGAGPALRPTSTLGGATYLGGYLALAVVSAVAATLARVLRWWWLYPVVAVDVVALLLTQSRGGWIGAALGSAVAVVWAARTRSVRSIWVWSGGAVVVIVAMVVIVPGLSSRASTLTRPAEGTAGARFVLAEMGVRAVADRPLLGWGPDLSRPALHDQIDSSFERTYRDDRIEDRAHNLFVDIAVWGGVGGLAVFVWFLVSVIRAIWPGRDDWTVVAIGLGVLAYGVHLMFNFPVPDLDIVVWLLAGSLVPAASLPGGAFRVGRPVPLYIAGAAGTVVLLLVASQSIDAVVADRHLRVGVDSENESDVDGARSAYEAARRSSPDSALYNEVLARFYLRVNRPELAEAAAGRGVSLDRTDPYMIELRARALTAISLANNEQSSARSAQALLEPLIETSPNDGSLHLELGTALAVQERYEDAESEYRKATQLIPARCEAYRNLALMEERNGDSSAAHLEFQRALFCDPNDRVAAAGAIRTEESG